MITKFKIFEAAFKDNIGMIETFQFYQDASDDQIEKLEKLISADKINQAWQLIQQVTGVNLQGAKFN